MSAATITPYTFTDPIYGQISFPEPLLIELVQSSAVQRLASIHQGGITAYIKPTRKTTRLEHSLGVAALLRTLGADVEEQAAGLVHDVPHTAFSHVIDFVFPNSEHDYHEKNSDAFILESDVPPIFAKHALDWRKVTDSTHYSLLEQPLPRLCADRLDYFLRDGVVDVGTFSVRDASAFLEHVQVWENEIVVDDIDAARWLGEQFIKLDAVCWCSPQEVGWYAVMARALRSAMELGIITEADFRSTDAVILHKLKAASKPEIDRWLRLLHPDVDFERVEGPADLSTLPKVRAVDPSVLQHGHATPLSKLDSAFAQHRASYIASKQGAWSLRILEP